MSRFTGVLAAALLACVAGGLALAAEDSKFTPLTYPQANSETRTGQWMCADLGKADEVLPLKTRLWATKESVTGGVALKCLFDPGSKASINWELDPKLPAGSAGLTFYAKASAPLKLRVQNAVADVGTDWKKIDLTWEAIGTVKDAPDIRGGYLVIAVDGGVKERTWVILDRIGTESPSFIASPKIDPQTGPDETISSKDIIYGQENLAKTLARAKDKKPFTIYALGDSITIGAQSYRGTRAVKVDLAKFTGEGVEFLYHHHLARLWREQFGYDGIKAVHQGIGGSIKPSHYEMLAGMLKNVTPDDVFIIELIGGLNTYKADQKKLISLIRAKTDQIIIMGFPTGEMLIGKMDEVTKTLKELVAEEKVAAVDITRFMQYRGEKFAWAGEGNEWHPTFMLHIELGEMMAPLLGGPERIWPEAAATSQPTPKP